MVTIPDGDWFCPKCISSASDEVCCIVCCRLGGDNVLCCSKCENCFVHETCLQDGIHQKLGAKNDKWMCSGCLVGFPAKEEEAKFASRTDVAAGIKQSPQQLPQRCLTSDLSAAGKKQRLKNGSIPIARKKSKSANNKKSSKRRPTFQDLCRTIMAELENHKDVWPFRQPVDMKTVPLYKKIIKKPMDLTQIRAKLKRRRYENEPQFVGDMMLMFENCRTFNEDDSAIGKAGHNVRKHFARRWQELKQQLVEPPINGLSPKGASSSSQEKTNLSVVDELPPSGGVRTAGLVDSL